MHLSFYNIISFLSYTHLQFSRLVCLTLCNTMECSILGVHVLHHLLELAHTHVSQVGDSIQPSFPLSFPSPPAFNLTQHQCLFQKVSFSYQVARVLELHYQSFQWIFRTDFPYNGLVWSPCSPKDSQESSPTPQFKSINSLTLSFLYGKTLTTMHDYWKNHSFAYMDLWGKVMSLLSNTQMRLVIAFLQGASVF